ncbi:ImmA/IrrE family metallo-endopeptidase [Bradyrhizobium sp. CB3481]|uniref:ImmA/IrrE family metallo-endopeptidase n=1 Tax=Bradyrhizobium sp. CB3481 TaxID=3039158 RepID=UPI0024B15CDF|nr:ImmA/IrrE family metallo-endopeptidase [Bradyrhizobium sp. CB3481]WFU18659.1 ImmA/IrrE family metallo-endopeptidase [Bradyrhizobium sp. CB3481]
MTGFCSVGKGHVEREANEFASWRLTPLDDFRKQIAPRDKPDFDAIGKCASRYEVSLVAAVLRWQASGLRQFHRLIRQLGMVERSCLQAGSSSA